MTASTFDDFVALSHGRFGKTDALCPFCDHLHRKRRKTLAIWHTHDDFLSYHCARCSAKGWAKADRTVAAMPSPGEVVRIRVEVEAREKLEVKLSRDKALRLWSLRRPVREVEPARHYLREARAYQGPIPVTVAALAPSDRYPPALIAAFGFADEPAPGVVDIFDGSVRGVHLIRLQADGRDRVRDETAKITVGRGSAGLPIVLAPPNDLGGLAITEGVEDGLAVYESTGLGVWAAGGSSRMPALAEAVPDWLDCVAVIGDDDSGRGGPVTLAERLSKRGLNVELRLYDKRRMSL